MVSLDSAFGRSTRLNVTMLIVIVIIGEARPFVQSKNRKPGPRAHRRRVRGRRSRNGGAFVEKDLTLFPGAVEIGVWKRFCGWVWRRGAAGGWHETTRRKRGHGDGRPTETGGAGGAVDPLP